MGRSKPFAAFEKKVTIYYLIRNSSLSKAKGVDKYKQIVYDGVSKLIMSWKICNFKSSKFAYVLIFSI